MIFFFCAAFLLVGWWTPWWSLLILAALLGWKSKSLVACLRDSFIGGFTAWLVLCTYFDYQNQMSVSRALAGLFSLPGTFSLLFVVSLLAGLMTLTSASLAFWLNNQIKSIHSEKSTS